MTLDGDRGAIVIEAKAFVKKCKINDVRKTFTSICSSSGQGKKTNHRRAEFVPASHVLLPLHMCLLLTYGMLVMASRARTLGAAGVALFYHLHLSQSQSQSQSQSSIVSKWF